MELLVGNEYVVNEFCFENKYGGTGLSDKKEFKPVTVKIIHSWEDYECGWRSHAKPVEVSKELVDYLNSHNCKNPTDPIFYVGEFDVDRKATADHWMKTKKFKL